MFAGRNTGDYRVHILVDARKTVGGLGRPVRGDAEAQPAEVGGEHFVLARLQLPESVDHHLEGLVESFLLKEQLGLDHHARNPKMGFIEPGYFGGQQQTRERPHTGPGGSGARPGRYTAGGTDLAGCRAT